MKNAERRNAKIEMETFGVGLADLDNTAAIWLLKMIEFSLLTTTNYCQTT